MFNNLYILLENINNVIFLKKIRSNEIDKIYLVREKKK